MITTLTYGVVALDEENGVLTIGFADDPSDVREYLLFQSWLDAEAEGENDEIYVERDDPSQGTYGGIERFILFRDHARLLLSSETAEVLATAQEVQLFFSATDEQFQQLEAALGVLFAGRTGLELRR